MGKEISFTLIPKKRSQKSNQKVNIGIYDYASDLFDELENKKFITRIKEIPQLGVIKVQKIY